MLRIGKVHGIDEKNGCVRVFFEDERIMSGRLKVIKSPSRNYLGECLLPWFPKINDRVLCIYNNGFNSDGFVLGAVE